MFRIFLINQRYFWILFLAFQIIGWGLFFFISKGDENIFLSQYHTYFLNYFFLICTRLGEGYFIVPIMFFLLFKKTNEFLPALLSCLLVWGIISVLKHVIYIDEFRPSVYLKDNPHLHLIPSFDLFTNNSFPSGHTAVAFSLFTSLSLIFKHKWIQITCILAAILVAISRIFLIQHFLLDVLVGAEIGVGFTVLIFFIFQFRKDGTHQI